MLDIAMIDGDPVTIVTMYLHAEPGLCGHADSGRLKEFSLDFHSEPMPFIGNDGCVQYLRLPDDPKVTGRFTLADPFLARAIKQRGWTGRLLPITFTIYNRVTKMRREIKAMWLLDREEIFMPPPEIEAVPGRPGQYRDVPQLPEQHFQIQGFQVTVT